MRKTFKGRGHLARAEKYVRAIKDEAKRMHIEIEDLVQHNNDNSATVTLHCTDSDYDQYFRGLE